MGKKTLTPVIEQQEVTDSSKKELFRIEESIEDFVSLAMKDISGCTKRVHILWTTKDGKSYCRCNYWKQDDPENRLQKRLVSSSFVLVEVVGNDKIVTDITSGKA